MGADDRALLLALCQLEVGAEEAGTRIRIVDLARAEVDGDVLSEDDVVVRRIFLADLKMLTQPR